MFYYAVDGAFEGDYNRMLIVTDRADQVLSIALLSEQPHITEGRERGLTGHTETGLGTVIVLLTTKLKPSHCRIHHKLEAGHRPRARILSWSIMNRMCGVKSIRS